MRKSYPKNRKSSPRKGCGIGVSKSAGPRTCTVCAAVFEAKGARKYCSRRCYVTAYTIQVEGDACWTWNGYKRPNGYGEAYFYEDGNDTRSRVLAHRAAYEAFKGPVGDACLCHKCDNPSCVNPGHLFLGTKTDNAADRDAKGRQAKGERQGSAKLTEAQVRLARQPDQSPTKLAKEWGVAKRTIVSIRAGKLWKHVA